MENVSFYLSTDYTRFQCYVHRPHIRSTFDIPFNRLKDRLTVNQAIFQIVTRRKDN